MNGVNYDALDYTFEEDVRIGKELMLSEDRRDPQTLLAVCKGPGMVQLIEVTYIES